MYGNKMIVPVFFLAFAAPIVVAQYRTTARPTYPVPSSESTNSYEPPTYAAPPTAEANYPPNSYQPSPTYGPSNPSTTQRPSYPPRSSVPSNPSPTYEASNPFPTYQPNNPSPTYEPNNPSPTYQPSNPSPTYQPSNPSPTYQPSNPSPTYEPNNPSPTYQPSNPSPAYEPSNPSPTYEPSNPSPTYEPSNPSPAYEPSNPSPAYEPSNPSPAYEPNNAPQNNQPGYDNNAAYGNDYNQGQDAYNVPYDLYPQIPVAPVRNIRNQIQLAQARINRLINNDRIQSDDVNALERKVNLSTRFRQEVENKLFGQLLANVTAQDRKIANFRTQSNGFSNLTDDVRGLTDRLNSLIGLTLKIRARFTETVAVIESLEDCNRAEDLSLVIVEDQGNGNNDLIDLATATITTNDAREVALNGELKQVVSVLNEERLEVITLTLTASNNTVRINYQVPFPRAPQLIYAIIGIEVVDIDEPRPRNTSNAGYNSGSTGTNAYPSGNTGYNSGSTGANAYPSGNSVTNDYRSGGYANNQTRSSYVNEAIRPRITASGDANGATVRLVDRSSGWRTEVVTVRLLAFTINNDQFPVGFQGNPGPESTFPTGEVSYSPY